MAEECQYYHYDSSPWGYGYTCLLKQSQDKDRTIDSDWVHKYCWNYNYNDCPFYQAKHGGSSSSCYLTSACTEARGLPDDCAELTAFRAFRDGYLAAQPDGEALIREYYNIAPGIVTCINTCSDRHASYERIREQYLTPCYEDLLAGRNADCKTRYVQMVRDLERKYLN